MTGMHRHTALRWVAYARRDRAEYLAARAEEATSSRPQQSRERLGEGPGGDVGTGSALEDMN
ncbi:hypothetical protein WDV06_09130 [Streptomyces racemochromogenes]|uniref:Uncharacterized protein n=1 Tax=Streptomyces racemochromogenes TaxID=67353 RepID=A0ABW7PA72_9ACTN